MCFLRTFFCKLLGTFNFWMDTIHCYGHDGSISEKPGEVDGMLDPAVIAVGTHKDKFEVYNYRRLTLELESHTINFNLSSLNRLKFLLQYILWLF